MNYSDWLAKRKRKKNKIDFPVPQNTVGPPARNQGQKQAIGPAPTSKRRQSPTPHDNAYHPTRGAPEAQPHHHTTHREESPNWPGAVSYRGSYQASLCLIEHTHTPPIKDSRFFCLVQYVLSGLSFVYIRRCTSQADCRSS